MTWREDRLHEGALIEDLPIRLQHGTLTLPAGTTLNVTAIVKDPEGSSREILSVPSIVVEYRILLVADGIRLMSRFEVRKSHD